MPWVNFSAICEAWLFVAEHIQIGGSPSLAKEKPSLTCKPINSPVSAGLQLFALPNAFLEINRFGFDPIDEFSKTCMGL